MAPLQAEISTIEADGDTRVAHRRMLRLQVQAASSKNSNGALVHNLSEQGLLIETRAGLQVGDILHVDLPEAGSTAALVIWTRGVFFGCGFVSPVSKAVVSAALLRSPAPAFPQGVPPFRFAETGWDRADVDDLRTPNRILMILSLLLALAVVTLFLLALLTFPFSS